MRLRRGAPPGPQAAWEYVPEGWSRNVRGWDTPEIEQVYRRRWPAYVRAVEGTGPLGVSHEVPEGVDVPTEDLGWHNIVLTYGYVLARAAVGGGRLSVLDWGGGPGHYYLLARALVPEIELDYHVRDLPRLVALGSELIPAATFHGDDSCLDRRYDLVFASNSFQFSRDIPSMLARLAAAASRFVYLTLLPTALEAPSFVILQRPDEHGYATEYLSWVVNRDELLAAAAAAALALEREFVVPGMLDIENAPENPIGHRGFLFRRS
jgi:putative methyltransferase (TIGR04325 family)